MPFFQPIRFFANGSIGANTFVSSAPPTGVKMRMYGANATLQATTISTGHPKIKLHANGTLECNTTILMPSAPYNIIKSTGSGGGGFSSGSGSNSISTVLSAGVGNAALALVSFLVSNANGNLIASTSTDTPVIVPANPIQVSSNTLIGTMIDINAASGNHTYTVKYSLPSASVSGVAIAGLNILTNVASIGATSNTTSVSPGTGTGAITGTAMTIPEGGALIAVCWRQHISGSDTLSAPAGNTSLGSLSSTGYIATCQMYTGNNTTVTPHFTSSSGTSIYEVQQFILKPTHQVIPSLGPITFIADQVGETSGFGGIVGLNGFLPETSNPISANSGNELIFFTKYQNTGLTITSNVGGSYAVLSNDVPLFGDELAAMYNATATGGSEAITVDNPSNGGQVWEAFLYEFANVASITDIHITGTTVGGSGTGPITGTASTVPVGSMLVARVSSSATAQPVVDLGSGTQLGHFNTAKGVLIGWQGAGASITPACNGASGVEYTMIQMTLKNT